MTNHTADEFAKARLARDRFTQADRDECMAAGHEWRWHKAGLRVVHDCICCGTRYVEEIDYEGER